jgi:hypothetical protein
LNPTEKHNLNICWHIVDTNYLNLYTISVSFNDDEGSVDDLIGVFRVKNHDFTPKNLIFSNFRGGVGAPGAPHPPGSAPA